MTTLFGSILATALVAQLQGITAQGKVIDDQGKPVADAQVVLSTRQPWNGSGDPVVVETRTDAAGQFRLALPPLKQPASTFVCAYRPGSAFAGRTINSMLLQSSDHRIIVKAGSVIAARRIDIPPFHLTLRKPQPRTVKVESPDGQPVPGAVISPRFPEVSAPLASALAVTTGPDGTATLNYLAARDKLVAVHLTAAEVGTQDLLLLESPHEKQGTTITIRLKPTRHLAGRVRNRAGQPVAGQEVEVWSEGSTWLRTHPVVFQNGPVRTAADGSFRTPDNLLVGSSYQVVIRGPGCEPILSKWITIGEQPPLPLPLLQRPLHAIHGRVVDRQGQPLASVEVFQSGDGPERTATKTDGDGRFVLGGFREGSVFLFARKDGFRFFGRLIRSGEKEIAVQLMRIGEHPAPELRTLPDPIPREESRALALRLIEPSWEAAVARKDQKAAGQALLRLAPADPIGTLQKLEAEDVTAPDWAAQVKTMAARALARSDPARAEAVADLIVDSPSYRNLALRSLADALPASAHARQIALFARAADQARAAKDSISVARVAMSLWIKGEKEKARALVAGSFDPDKLTPLQRSFVVAYELAVIDPPVALRIARDSIAGSRDSANRTLRNVAIGLAADHPAEAERVLRMIPQEQAQSWLHPAIVWKMAARDPARARRLVDESQSIEVSPQTYFYLACGLKARDPAAAEEAFWKGIHEIDRLLAEGADSFAMQIQGGATLLPLVEQIDPALVPEVFWRAIAARSPIGDPRSLSLDSSGNLAALLSWYDREIAAALFEPVHDLMDQTDDRELATWTPRFVNWWLVDPRAAFARIERLRVTTDADAKTILGLKELMGMWFADSYEERWRLVWQAYGYGEMRAPLERDVW